MLLCLVAAVCRTGPETTAEPPGWWDTDSLNVETDKSSNLLLIIYCVMFFPIKYQMKNCGHRW